ncbi:MAG: ATP-grasp domain-containing protein, partial [Pseudomonadota bacterium]
MRPDHLIIVSEGFDGHGQSVSYDSQDLMLAPAQQLSQIESAFSQIFKKVTTVSDANSFVREISSFASCIVLPYSYGPGSEINRVAHVTAACEAVRLPYIGADSYTRILCRDKWLSQRFIKDFGLDTPPSVIIRRIDETKKASQLPKPIIVKPNSQSNSFFIDRNSVVDSIGLAAKRIEEILLIGDCVIAEQFIDAEEYSICYIGSKRSISLRQVIQRVPNKNTIDEKYKNAILDYRTNQVPGFIRTQVGSNEIPPEILRRTDELFRSLTKCNYLRIDGRFDGERFFIIELTPDAGLAPSHSISKAAEFAGLSY